MASLISHLYQTQWPI